MEENNMKANLNHLKEIILDEDRLVTYISLSKDLCIHVNDAKLLLKAAVDELKKERRDIKLNVNYIISGLADTNGGRVTICSDAEMEDVRNTFKIVFFHHIYSVVKGSSLIDKAALMLTNKFEDLRLCMGLIKNDFCFKRTSNEIGILKSNSQESVSDNKLQSAPVRPKYTKPIKAEIKVSSEDIVNAEKQKGKTEKLPEVNIKQEITSPKNQSQNSTNSINRKSNNKASKDIAGYFSKANGVESTKVSKKVNKTIQNTNKNMEEKQIEIKPEKADNISTIPKKLNVSTKEPVVHKEISVNETKSKKTIKPNKLNAKVDKKRKRVLRVSDSESDNDENDPFTEQMCVDNESEDEIPPTPLVNTVKITSGIINPKKKRKIVDKTYTDEDGYILTKKEEVYESCSDKEEETAKKENIENKVQIKPEHKIEVSPKGKNNKAAKKKISPPQKGKQATMTSFFKKV